MTDTIYVGHVIDKLAEMPAGSGAPMINILFGIFLFLMAVLAWIVVLFTIVDRPRVSAIALFLMLFSAYTSGALLGVFW